MQFLRKSVRRSGDKKETFATDFHKVILADNGKDNVPVTFKRSSEEVYFISQSRSPGYKDVGQDAVGVAEHGAWLCQVLCDGHDRDGHLVARRVVSLMPNMMIKNVIGRDNPETEVTGDEITRVFTEVADEVAWTGDSIAAGMFVKIKNDSGKFSGKLGYVGENRPNDEAIVIVVDDDGYHRPQLPKKSLLRPAYTGGCTCVVVLLNRQTNQCRIAITGDSRALIMNCGVFEDPLLRPVFGLTSIDDDSVPPMALTTPAHNVFNPDELMRLNTEHAGAFEIDGAFLVNPISRFSIQPTRGIGDSDMLGTGYTSEPEVSGWFELTPGSVLMVASDGVFDEHVWHDDEVVSFLSEHLSSPTADLEKVGSMLYNETVDRSLLGNYVDDISISLIRIGDRAGGDRDGSTDSSTAIESEEAVAAATEEKSEKRKSRLGNFMKKTKPALSKLKSQSLSVSVKDLDVEKKPAIEAPNPEDRRKTIDRTDRGQYTQISKMITDAMKKKEEGGSSDDEQDSDLVDIVLERYASQYGVDPEQVKLDRRKVSKDAANAGKRVSALLSQKDVVEEDDEDN